MTAADHANTDLVYKFNSAAATAPPDQRPVLTGIMAKVIARAEAAEARATELEAALQRATDMERVVHEPDKAALENADARVDESLQIWADCLAADSWPGYPVTVNEVGPVPWERDSWADVDLEEVPF